MIWSFCIRRPVLTIVMFLVAAIFGLYGYSQMPVQEDPDVDFPIVSITTLLPGAAPGVVESEVIEPLEAEINSIEGLRQLRSTAREEVGEIIAEFELWRDIDVAAQDVRDAVSRAQGQLPSDAESPVVRKLEADAQPIMWVPIMGDERWSEVDLTDYVEHTLKQRLETIRGVGQIMVGGMREYAVRIRLDVDRLAAHDLTATEVVSAIQSDNVDIPSGRIEGERREFLIHTRGQFASAEPFNDLIVAYRNGSPVRLADVGEAIDGIAEDRQLGRFSGEPTVGMGLVKQTGANTVELARLVREQMKVLEEDFPPGLKYDIGMDASVFIEESIRDLQTTIFLATVLVMLVVLFFLRSPRGTLITLIAIPTSLLTALAVISALGFSINTLTMMALILVIGIAIDDAIIVLERSYLHLEQGADREAAARVGTTEVAFPNIANTAALCAVFLPVAFTGGMIGRFFLEFGVTVAVAVVASTLVALTLTPMLCSRMLKVPSSHGLAFRVSERIFAAIERVFRAVLHWAFRHRGLTVLLGIGMFAFGLVLAQFVSQEFQPVEDRSAFMIVIETSEGATLAETDAYAREIEAILADTPEVAHQFLGIGMSQGGPGRPNRGQAFVDLIPRDARDRHQREVMQEVRERIGELTGGRAFVMEPGYAGLGDPVEIVLQNSDMEALARHQDLLMEFMEDRPELFVGVRTDLELNSPQVDVHVDRERARALGVSVADVANTLRYLFGGVEISTVERDGLRYEVRTDVVGRGGHTPAILQGLYLRGENGELVPFESVASFEESIGPAQIQRFNRIRSATVSSQMAEGAALGDAIAEIEAFIAESIPPGTSYELAGQSQAFEESVFYLLMAMMFAIIFIYLILAAQFESFLHPFTIILALPLSLVGVFGGLWLTGRPLNVLAFIGVIMLMGLVAKNGILLVDYANVLVGRGRPVIDAAREAAEQRFRPVIMTAVSTILGIMPIALGMGAGGEGRAPLGIAVAFGLATSTLLTLLVVPVVYTLIDQLQDRLLGRRERGANEALAFLDEEEQRG